MRAPLRRRVGLAALLGWLLAAPAAAQTPVATLTLTGLARVVEAGSIVIIDVPVRLFGIAAPPKDAASMVGLYRLVDSRILTCHLFPLKPADTPADRVAGCEAAGIDIGAQLVEAGLALDCPAVSNGRYRRQEERARAAGKDLSSRFSLPASCAAPVSSRRGR